MAQTIPSRLTTAAHSLLSSPPLLGPPLGLTLFLKMSANRSWSTGHEGPLALFGAWAAACEILNAAHSATIDDEMMALCIIELHQSATWHCMLLPEAAKFCDVPGAFAEQSQRGNVPALDNARGPLASSDRDSQR